MFWNSHNTKSASMLSLSGSSRELSQTRRMRDYVQRPVTWVTRLTSGAILEPFYLCTMSCWGLSDDVLYMFMTHLCMACNVTPFQADTGQHACHVQCSDVMTAPRGVCSGRVIYNCAQPSCRSELFFSTHRTLLRCFSPVGADNVFELK